jgi:hypothetical protein
MDRAYELHCLVGPAFDDAPTAAMLSTDDVGFEGRREDGR